jgi:hypothetical protein
VSNPFKKSPIACLSCLVISLIVWARRKSAKKKR